MIPIIVIGSFAIHLRYTIQRTKSSTTHSWHVDCESSHSLYTVRIIHKNKFCAPHHQTKSKHALKTFARSLSLYLCKRIIDNPMTIQHRLPFSNNNYTQTCTHDIFRFSGYTPSYSDRNTIDTDEDEQWKSHGVYQLNSLSEEPRIQRVVYF